MAKIKKDPSETTGGYHLTNRDEKAYDLITTVGKRIVREDLADDKFETARHAAEVVGRMERVFASAESVLATPTEFEKHRSPLSFHSPAAMTPLPTAATSAFASFHNIGGELVDYRENPAKSRMQELIEKYGFRPAVEAPTQLSSIRKIAEAEKDADKRKFQPFSGLENYHWKPSRTIEEKDPMQRFQKIGPISFGDSSDDEAKRENRSRNRRRRESIDNISKGITKAFKTSGSVISKAFGALTGTRGQIAATGIAAAIIRNELRAGNQALAISNAATMTGAKAIDIANLGLVAKRFGGDEKTAAQFHGLLNKLVEGELYDDASSFRKAAMDYGLNISGSGRGGLATREEMFDRLADWYSERAKIGDDRSRNEIARMSQVIGIDAPMAKILELGREGIREAISQANFYIGGSDTVEKLTEQQRDFNQTMGRLMSVFNQIALHTGIIPMINDKLAKITEDVAVFADSVGAIGGTENIEYDTEEDMPWWRRWFGGDESKMKGLGLTEENWRKYQEFIAPRKVGETLQIGAAGGLTYVPQYSYRSDEEKKMFLDELRALQIKGTVTVEDKNGNVIGEGEVSVAPGAVMNQVTQ